MTGCHRRTARLTPATIHSAGRTRAVIVEIAPPGDVIGFRLKGCRTTYNLPTAHLYREAVRNELARLGAERRAARKANGH